MVFRLAEESFGVDIFRVNEIISVPEVTTVAKSDNYVRGIVNLRGQTIPIVDLSEKLNVGHSGPTEEARIIVVESADGPVGMIVDAVTEVVTFQRDEIDEPPGFVTAGKADFVKGVALRQDRLVTILDLDKAIAA